MQGSQSPNETADVDEFNLRCYIRRAYGVIVLGGVSPAVPSNGLQ